MENSKRLQESETKSPHASVSLPIPNPEVVGMTDNDAVLMKYIESIEEIAKKESQTLIEIEKLRNNYKLKIALILAALTGLGLGYLFGVKMKGQSGGTSITVEPRSSINNKK